MKVNIYEKLDNKRLIKLIAGMPTIRAKMLSRISYQAKQEAYDMFLNGPVIKYHGRTNPSINNRGKLSKSAGKSKVHYSFNKTSTQARIRSLPNNLYERGLSNVNKAPTNIMTQRLPVRVRSLVPEIIKKTVDDIVKEYG